MPAEIRETTVTPDANGSVVRLRISDAPLHPESVPTFHLDLTVTLPEYDPQPLLSQFQAQALQAAQKTIQAIDSQLLHEIRKHHQMDLNPKLARP